MSIEEPTFTVVLHEGDYELRDYHASVVAEVTVTGDQKTAASRGFRSLAGYIFGGNTRRQKISMTAPVTQERTSQKIAMTAPLTQTQSAGAWVVRFTMPHAYSLETLPVPNNPSVTLRNMAPSRFAVLRFSGLANMASVRAETTRLIDFVETRHLHSIGEASLAQYNPPWTLWFLRRNEVMIQVAG